MSELVIVLIVIVALQFAADLFLVWLLLRRARVVPDDELAVARAVDVVIEP